MLGKVKLYNETHQKYLAYLQDSNNSATYPVLLLEDDAKIGAGYVWHALRVADGIVVLQVPSLLANLAINGDASPSANKKTFVARLAKMDSMSPVELKYDEEKQAIITISSPDLLYLSGISKDPYAYFVEHTIDKWEIQYL
ncbi:hypothetical protein [Brucella haematophila]|uniref:Uncharacterized protein n=1 Tax=Brucella haematophila TaxID=419474 RepID=A0ABX1DP51_9HYPH|nr:hypothetical protein [Brucella haematophila]NKC04591.1 hypothetical protein [Brucella haematophila]TMV04019.1 hypothetical protein FGI60_08610 [Brucella haematophila]